MDWKSGRLIGAEIHCPFVAYHDTVSRNALGADFFLLLRDSRAKSGDNNIHSTPYLVIYGGGVGLARTAGEDPEAY